MFAQVNVVWSPVYYTRFKMVHVPGVYGAPQECTTNLRQIFFLFFADALFQISFQFWKTDNSTVLLLFFFIFC